MKVNGQPIRILLVEDSEDDSDLLLLELQRGGYEPVAHRVATADEMRNQQFRVGFDGGPGPSVSSAIDRIFHRGDILLLGGSERPDFTDLNALGF